MGDLDSIHAGLELQEALARFRKCCNTGPHRLFVTDSWLEPYLDRMHSHMRSVITEDHATVLRAVVEKRESVKKFVQWVSENFSLSWAEFNELLSRKAEQQRTAWEADKVPRMRRLYEEWNSPPKPIPSGHPELPPIFPEWSVTEKDAESLAQAKQQYRGGTEACPMCGTAPESLRWRHATYSAFAGLAGCGWTGWIVSCERCKLGIAEHRETFTIA